MKQTVRLFFAAALLAALFACKVPEPVVESTHVPDPTPISEEAVALATPAMTPVPTPAPTAEPSPEPTPEPTPEPIPSVWIFGREIACDTETLDLSDTESPSPDELSAALPLRRDVFVPVRLRTLCRNRVSVRCVKEQDGSAYFERFRIFLQSLYTLVCTGFA